jgi:hypothetical protein
VPGTILAGKYRVARILGQGGMGVVVEAHHIQLDDRVALKFLLPEYATHPEASERFLREARAAVKIKSEHVARVSDVGTLDTGAPYMVMEFLEGSDLSSILENNGPLPLTDAVGYLIQACEAINEAHGYGIVHRDIKPANLFVTKRPDGSPLVKVLDFGISKTMGAGVDGLTRTTATMGSALYMSPEQMRQSRSVDCRTDIYSLGITLYELLAGKQPFYANTLPELCAEVLTGTPTPLRDLRGDLPGEFAPALERAYARNLEQRYQTVTELVFALAPFAPPRSQEIIDRFARLSNVPAPRAGQPAPAGAVPMKTEIGTYNPMAIPQSQRVTDAFATGAPGGLSATANSGVTAPVQKKGSGAALAFMIVGALALGGAGAGAWYLHGQSKGGDIAARDAKTDAGKSANTSEPATSETAAREANSSDALAAAPSATASAEPAASSAEPAESAEPAPSVVTHAPPPAHPTHVAVTPPPRPPPPPPVATPPKPPPTGNNAGSYR